MQNLVKKVSYLHSSKRRYFVFSFHIKYLMVRTPELVIVGLKMSEPQFSSNLCEKWQVPSFVHRYRVSRSEPLTTWRYLSSIFGVCYVSPLLMSHTNRYLHVEVGGWMRNTLLIKRWTRTTDPLPHRSKLLIPPNKTEFKGKRE